MAESPPQDYPPHRKEVAEGSTTKNPLEEIKAELARATADGVCPNPNCRTGTIKPKDTDKEIHWCTFCKQGTVPKVHDIIERLANGDEATETCTHCVGAGCDRCGGEGYLCEQIPPNHRLLEALVADALGLEVVWAHGDVWGIVAEGCCEFVGRYTTSPDANEAVLEKILEWSWEKTCYDSEKTRDNPEGTIYEFLVSVAGDNVLAKHPFRFVSVCMAFLKWHFGKEEHHGNND